MPDDFPINLKSFIDQQIISLAQLEVLLFLRQHANRQVHPAEIVGRLAITTEMAASILGDLVRRGLAVKTDARFCYQAATPEIDQVVQALADAYRDRRLAVTNEIYSKPLDNVKTFAEAFRLRKEE
jgi:hypothetical protein